MKNVMMQCIVLLLILSLLFSNIPLSANDNTSSGTSEMIKGNKNNIIEQVPYVSQETGFYCAYASPTMIFKYFGINTTLHEVLFNSGVGYSLVYSPPILPRLPAGSVGSSMWKADRSFLAELYGLSYMEWRADTTLSEHERWTEYWIRVKQNISNNIPVITNVEPSILPSIRNSLIIETNISDTILEKITNRILDLFSSGFYHAIVLVGFNESNGTICFNDPLAGVLNHPKEGTYVWMKLTKFRNAHKRLSSFFWQSNLSYLIGTFNDTPKEPLDKTIAFELAYKRNIEKLKGNLSAYDDHVVLDWECTNLGINTVKTLKNHLGKGIQNHITTLILYKSTLLTRLFYIQYNMCKFVEKIFSSNINLAYYKSLLNYFHEIAIEKHNISQYLQKNQYHINDTNLSKICQHDAILLKQESENWTKLAKNFYDFLERGVFMTSIYAIPKIKEMATTTEDIILIESKIIDNSI